MNQQKPFKHLTSERFLQLFVEQAGSMAQGVTCSTIESFIQKIVLNSSEVLEEIYRDSKDLDPSATLGMQDYGNLLVSLKNSIGGNFKITELNEDYLSLQTDKCPFGASVESAPALCHMTSSIFGGIAARNYGYAKVELKKRIALGSDHCDICIHRDPDKCKDVIGDEYFSDGVKIIAEVRAPSELQKRVEERLHSLWLKDNHPTNKPDNKPNNKPPTLIAHSDAMLSILKIVDTVAPTDVPVLISGETGVGKEVIARSIHAMSQRHTAPFIAVNCGSIPQDLVETELFGHEAGAYTDAKKERKGRFERADKGTLFLDEVDSLSLKAQVSLLRVLQEHQFERVGGNELIKCDVRIIAATNQNILDAVHSNKFRQDLYYRLNVVPLFIPPLRDRRDDLIPLTEHLLECFADRYQTKKKSLLCAAASALHKHDWPGNVRELENVLERSFLFSDDIIIHRIMFDLTPASYTVLEKKPNIKREKQQAADTIECQILEQALIKHCGQVEKVAQFLNLSTRAVYQKIKYHKLNNRLYEKSSTSQ